ncbi:CoA transferase [Solirubrobacter ginsenosidimutans]|uniref:CoA transferase n=1 Tax=Solirubrobacter ginsenosidimutans TaxID=490573 RepID=A0A9X3MQC2_9ACTN|nr:CoA transferase [Solirubrobacter ginsenosidimutans]MDA0159922.1 CoA transferase [Solirubrobacter ginsenosidimutans]
MAGESVLAGVKVLDAASFIAGPAAAAVLADFGAEVIKLEPPAGDLSRVLSSVPPCPRARANYSWELTNRNKRSVAIDLKAPTATEVLSRLVGWADVVITNFPHGTREKLHLGYEEVSGWNPHVIYADVTGFGDAGPDAALPGFDLTAYWARSGLLASTRDAGAPPTVPIPGSGDYAAAMSLCAAIATALYHRERTGQGMSVGTSLLAAGVWSAGTFVAGALAGGTSFGAHDPAAPTNPLINPYQSADGRWLMLVVSPPHWPGLAAAVGYPSLPEDPRFADAERIARNSATLTELLDTAFRSQPLAHWREVLDRAHITYGVVQTPEEAAADPQLRANGVVVPLDGDDDLTETISSPITLRGRGKTPARRAPAIGEHNDDVLGELGFDRADIARLRAAGVIPSTARAEAA